jgi:hypothetical protein
MNPASSFNALPGNHPNFTLKICTRTKENPNDGSDPRTAVELSQYCLSAVLIVSSKYADWNPNY